MKDGKMTKPLNIAHRGGADLWPENTMQAFERAIEMGVDGLEFDLQLTADNILAIHHDARLKPEATRLNGAFLDKPTPRLDALSFQDLQAFDVGTLDACSAYGQRRAARANLDNLRIPDLTALEHLVAEKAPPGFRLYTELKTDMGADGDQAARLADAYLTALETSPIAERHIVVSFDWRCLTRIRAARPDMPHAYTTLEFALTDPTHKSRVHDTPLSATIRAASAAGAPWFDGYDWRDMTGDSHGEKMLNAIASALGGGWFAAQDDVNRARMAQAHEANISVSAWTVNEAHHMQRLSDLGVTALISDRPDILGAL